jgi:hypothetical protein
MAARGLAEHSKVGSYQVAQNRRTPSKGEQLAALDGLRAWPRSVLLGRSEFRQVGTQRPSELLAEHHPHRGARKVGRSGWP